MPLAELVVPSEAEGVWVHSKIFTEVHSATLRNMTPSAFRACSEEDKAQMIQHDQEWDGIINYERYLINRKLNP